MSKLIYITESQFKTLVEDWSYCNSGNTVNPFKYGGAEITVNSVTGNDTDDDVELGKPVTGDEFASQLVPQRNHWSRGATRTNIHEVNQAINKKKIGLSDRSEQTAQQLGIDTTGLDCNHGFVVRNRIANGNYDGKVSQEDLKQLDTDLGGKLKTQMDISRNDRKAKMERGENVLKSAPKTGAKGGAHTPKGNNVIGVTYKN